MVKKAVQRHEKNYKGEAVIIFLRKCYANMLQNALKNNKGRRLVIVLVQLKKWISQTAEKMYKDEGIKLFVAIC